MSGDPLDGVEEMLAATAEGPHPGPESPVEQFIKALDDVIQKARELRALAVTEPPPPSEQVYMAQHALERSMDDFEEIAWPS